MSETSLFESLEKLLKEEKPFALVTLVEGPNTGAKILVQPFGEEVEGTLGNEELDRVAIRDALGELAAGRSGIRHYGQHGEAREETVQVFIESFAPPPQMLIFGAVDFTGALVKVAKVLGYRVTVCDAREVFATKKRFPQADEVIAEWPNRLIDQVGPSLNSQDAICILTHDNKFDVPAVLSSLKTQVGYIGIMGSRRTHGDRLVRLKENGVSEEEITRLRSPIGMDIGARSPEETAISIVSEIIALRTGRPMHALKNTAGPIHG